MSTVKTQVEEFISSKSQIIKDRKLIFNNLFDFVLNSDQWTAEEEADLIADGFNPLELNFSSDFVDRYIARLFPRNQRTGILEVGVKVFEDDDGKKIKKVMDAYRRNYLPAILIEQAVNFLIGGAACLYYPQDPVTKKTKIISLDPRNVSLSFSGDKLVRFAHSEKFKDGTEETIYWDLENYVYILDSDKKKEVVHEKNIFGFIPVSWIPCAPRPHTREGRSKVLSLINLEKENNKIFANFSKRIYDNAIPHTNVFSNSAHAGDYERGRKKVSYFGQDDDVRQEEFKESPEILEYIKLLDSRMRRKTGIVDIGAAIKSVVSGISLSFQFSEMMDLIGFMRVYWDKGIREINNAILNYEIAPGDYDSDPIYNPVLAFDSRQKVDEYSVLLDQKLITRKDAITELRAIENPDQVIKDIIEEDKLFAYLNKNKNQEEQKNKKSELATNKLI